LGYLQSNEHQKSSDGRKRGEKIHLTHADFNAEPPTRVL
jgi:hypothetical protein